MIYQITGANSTIVAAGSYNNSEAHNELKAMMNRNERIQFYPTVDRFGCEAIRVESKTTQGFNYQMNQNSFDWVMNYLMKGENEDINVNPTEIEKSEFADADSFREAMLKLFIESGIGRIQFTPEFRDRTGRLTATATFRHGTVLFFVPRTEELTTYLRGKELIR